MSSLTRQRKRGLKIDSMEAARYMRSRTTKVITRKIGDSVATGFKPSTAEYRQVLHDPRTPRGVKGHVYQWLLVRRNRARRAA